MSWQPDKDPVLGDNVPAMRWSWSSCRACAISAASGAPCAAAWQAADGRALHLLRSDGSGAARRRPGHGRAAASAYRPGDRHLSLRRPRHASRQRRQRAGDHARRHEPDDRRARHRAFGAHARQRARDGRRHVRHPELDRAPADHEEIGASFQHFDAANCLPSRTAACGRA